MNKKAFSLVELIVVIAIIAILGTIATFTLSKWLGRNRDAARSADINNIMSSLETYKYEYQSYPFPDDYTLITYSGATVWYQWYIWSTVIKKLELKNDPKDPYDNSYYTYSVDETKDKFQIWTLLEKEIPLSYDNTVKAEENDYSERFINVKWDRVGIIFDSSNTPLQELYTGGNVELQSMTDDYQLYFANDEYLTGDGETMFSHIDMYRSSLDIYNTDLAFHLNFDKWYGYTAYDSSVNELNGSLNDGAEWIEGIYGNGVFYDGIDNNVTIVDDPLLDPNDLFTVSFWINPMALPTTNATLIDKVSYGASFLTSGELKVYAAASSNSITQAIDTNKRTHVAFSYDKVKLKLYINGEFISELSLTSAMPANGSDVTIGDWFLRWIIDEVYLYRKMLSDDEVRSLYNVYK